MEFDTVVRARRSTRAFLPTPVPVVTVHELLQTAALAPSGTNIQPWLVHVVMGATRKHLVDEILAHRDTAPPDGRAEFARGDQRRDPYLSRMRALGKDMYTRLGIAKGDQAAGWRQWGRNYEFFDAPVGLIFTVDRNLDAMAFLDIGIFMQTMMLAACDRGLSTCAQGAWNMFWSVTRRVLSIPEDQHVVAGLALGYADPDAPVNAMRSEREPVASFSTFHE